MDETGLHEVAPESAPAPLPEPETQRAAAALYVVTQAFGDHSVGEEIGADEAERAPSHAVVRRGQPAAEPQV